MALTIDKTFNADLAKPINVRYGGGLVFTGDAGADTFVVNLYKNGSPYSPGGTVALNCIRADGNTVTVAGSISGNTATATLTQACCAIPGPLTVVMQIVSGGNTGAVFAAAYSVMSAQTGSAIDPGTTITDISALIAQIDAAVDSIPADYSELLAAIAPNYSQTTYAVGDYVWHEGDLYRCVTAIAAGETWTAAHWTQVTVGDELSDLKGEINGLGDDVAAVESAIHDVQEDLDFGTIQTENNVTSDLVSGQKYGTGGNVGTTMSPTPTSNQNYKSAAWAVNTGDIFVVTGREGSDPHAFTDSSYKILSKGTGGASLSGVTFTATEPGYLFLNLNVNIPATVIRKTVAPITVHDMLDEKLDVNQGSANNGKILKVGADGVVAPADNIQIDSTLTESGEAADALAAGEAINAAKSDAAQTFSRIEDNFVKIPNMFIDPTFKDVTDTNSFVFVSQASEEVQNAILTCTSQKTSNQSITLKIADSLATDIIYYNYKVSVTGLNGYSLNCSFAGRTANISTESTSQVVGGYCFGGESKALILSIGGTSERVINIYCPIAINVTALFGAGHEPTFTEFSTMIANWNRDNAGEWISLQKYEFLQKRAVVLAQNIAVRNVLDDYSNLVTLFTETPRDVTGDGNNAYVLTSTILYQNQYSVGDVIYTSITAKVSDSDCLKIALYQNSAPDEDYKMMEVESPASGTWYRLSGIFVPKSTTGTERFAVCAAHYADAETQTGKTLSFKLGIGLNLTAIFGKGHEPMDASVIDTMLTRYPNQWFAGIQDIWHPAYAIGMAGRIRDFANGAYYGEDGEGRFIASSIIDASNEDWTHAQYTYGLDKFLVKVPHQFDGGIETNGMYTVMLPKYARWERGAAGADAGSLFGGHIFEAWNNIGTYRLTMMMAHGGDKVSYTDPEDDVTTETAREDEACIIVYSPGGSYSNPLKTPTELQSHLRIRRSRDDYYFGTNPQNLLGRVRIGSDTATEGVVFTRTKLISYNQMILADKTQENKGKLLKFNNDGTVTWEEVDLYGNWVPEENNT